MARFARAKGAGQNNNNKEGKWKKEGAQIFTADNSNYEDLCSVSGG